jgi:hypothetical protein
MDTIWDHGVQPSKGDIQYTLFVGMMIVTATLSYIELTEIHNYTYVDGHPVLLISRLYGWILAMGWYFPIKPTIHKGFPMPGFISGGYIWGVLDILDFTTLHSCFYGSPAWEWDEYCPPISDGCKTRAGVDFTCNQQMDMCMIVLRQKYFIFLLFRCGVYRGWPGNRHWGHRFSSATSPANINFDYPPVIKRDNGKSPNIMGGFNGKFIYKWEISHVFGDQRVLAIFSNLSPIVVGGLPLESSIPEPQIWPGPVMNEDPVRSFGNVPARLQRISSDCLTWGQTRDRLSPWRTNHLPTANEYPMLRRQSHQTPRQTPYGYTLVLVIHSKPRKILNM